MSLLLITILMLLCSALFSGLEIAFITSDKMMIEMNKARGKKFSYRILSEFIKKPSRFIATLLIGNNLALVVFGIYMEELLTPHLSPYINSAFALLLGQTLISTIIILIFGEYLPKALFQINPNKILYFFAYPLFTMYWLLKYVVMVFVNISKFILTKFFKLSFEAGPTMFGRIELEEYLENRTYNSKESDVDTEVQIYKNVLEFSGVKVRECMIPRTEIIALDVHSDVDTLIKIFVETGLSKVLIYRGNIDEIIGFVHHSEMFKNPKQIKNVLLPVGFIPSTMLAQEALNSFIKQQKSVLVVVDEFGGTAGMVTAEDVMEEIFGEIEDEHDTQEYIETQIAKDEFLFSGRLDVDYLNETYDLKIPTSEDYETIAGLLFTHFESIPEVAAEWETDDYRFIVEEVSETRIELVRVKCIN